MERKFDLEDRLVDFAADVIPFVLALPNDQVGRYYGDQILRSSGSTALNFGEVQGTQTTKDYIFKASIVLKELKESRVNLRILKKANYGNLSIVVSLLDEIEQLIRIIATIIKNKQREL